MDLILWAVGLGLCGGLLGCLTGITPGLHVNTLALLLLGATGGITTLLAPLVGHETPTLLMAILLASAALAHTFTDFIPSTFLGAPEGDTALSVLPAHRMLLVGQGYRAVCLSAVGSLGALVLMLLLLLPIKWILGSPVHLYLGVQPFLFHILLMVCFILVITESRKVAYRRIECEGHRVRVKGRWSGWLGRLGALCLLGLSGLLGLVCWNLGTTSPVGLPSSVLFPLFTGLFGLSTLLLSMDQKTSVPEQKLETSTVTHRELTISSGIGTLAGGCVALLPGLTSGIGTVLAMQIHHLRNRLEGREPTSSFLVEPPDHNEGELEGDPDYQWALGLELDGDDRGAWEVEPEDHIKIFRIEDHDLSKPSADAPDSQTIEPVDCKEPSDTKESDMVSAKGLDDTERTILTLGAVNTSATLTVLAGLFIIQRSRSGTALAIESLLIVEPWTGYLPPTAFVYILIGLLASMAVAYPATFLLARRCASFFPRLDYQQLVKAICLALVVMVLLFTGPVGVLVLLTATTLGLIAPLAGLRRSNAMGVLLIPILKVYSGL